MCSCPQPGLAPPESRGVEGPLARGAGKAEEASRWSPHQDPAWPLFPGAFHGAAWLKAPFCSSLGIGLPRAPGCAEGWDLPRRVSSRMRPHLCLLLLRGLPCDLPSPFSQGLRERPRREKVGPVTPEAKTESAHPTLLVRAGSGRSPRRPQKQGLWGRAGASWLCPPPWPAGRRTADKSPPGGGQGGSTSWA